jgi:hypothetical protein
MIAPLTAGRDFPFPERLPLGDGTALRLLSSYEVLRAREEAAELTAARTGGGGESPPPAGATALCVNACILARAWEKDGRPVCRDGGEVLARLTVSALQRLAARWAAFDRASNPGFAGEEKELEDLQAALADTPVSRLRWRVLREFRVLPTERRAREMKERDWLWCILHLLRDDEEAAARLCPDCRRIAEAEPCPVCGAAKGGEALFTAEENENFDAARFARLQEGRL